MNKENTLIDFDDSVYHCVEHMADSLMISRTQIFKTKLAVVKDIVNAIKDLKRVTLDTYSTKDRITKWMEFAFIELKVNCEIVVCKENKLIETLDKKSQSALIKRLEVDFGSFPNLTYSPFSYGAFLVGFIVGLLIGMITSWWIAIATCILLWGIFIQKSKRILFRSHVTLSMVEHELFLYHYGKFRDDNSVNEDELHELIFGIFVNALGVDRSLLDDQTKLIEQ